MKKILNAEGMADLCHPARGRRALRGLSQLSSTYSTIITTLQV